MIELSKQIKQKQANKITIKKGGPRAAEAVIKVLLPHYFWGV